MPQAIPYLPVSYLRENAARAPDSVAVYDLDRRVTFSELARRVDDLAALLRAEGLRDGEVVGVQLPNVWEYVALELAIPHAGGIILPLPPALGRHELAEVIGRSGMAYAVIGHGCGDDLAALAPDFPLLRDVLPVDALVDRDTTGTWSGEPADPERIVEIALTSGTTGLPKLAALSARLKQATFEAFTSRLEISPEDRVLIMSPITQGIGGMCLYFLRRGAALVMLHRPHFSAEHTLAVAEETHATFLVGVPTNVTRLLASAAFDRTDLSSLRATAVAGAPMPPDASRAWEERTGARVCIFYGSMDAGQLAVGRPSDSAEHRWHSVGKPHDVAELRIVDGAGRDVPGGEIGEICMRGPTVQERYWREERGPFAEDGWAHMGDLGYLDGEGYLHVTGRIKDIIIRGGTNINPHEVETILQSHPAIAEVCVVGRPDPDLGERVVAFVVPRPDRSLDLDVLRAFLREQGVARYKWPEWLVTLSELPLSGPGKLNRRALRERAQALTGGRGEIGVR